MQPDLRRVHGAPAHREGDHPQWHAQALGQRGGPPHHLHRLGRAGVAAGDPGQQATARAPVAARCDGHRNRARVQQTVRGGTHDHLSECAGGRGAQYQDVGSRFGDHLHQPAGHRTVRVAVEADLHRRQSTQQTLRLPGRVGGQLIGPGRVLGVHPGRRRVGPRPRDDGRHRQRGAQRACRVDGQMQRCGATLAREVSDDDGHAAAPSLTPGFNALWWRPQVK